MNDRRPKIFISHAAVDVGIGLQERTLVYKLTERSTGGSSVYKFVSSGSEY
ncbi:MAG: hypothetical protein Q7J15_08145 [Candidatus Desulfaltia sp.]|nr:hypothetical protein [Candidatus Desulfaltia sp.]